MVRTYWFVPIFYEAIDILDLQPLARPAPSKPVVPGDVAPPSVRGLPVLVKELRVTPAGSGRTLP